MTKIVAVLEDFQNWNTWYRDEAIQVPEGLEAYPNQPIVLKGQDTKAHGLVKDNKIVK